MSNKVRLEQVVPLTLGMPRILNDRPTFYCSNFFFFRFNMVLSNNKCSCLVICSYKYTFGIDKIINNECNSTQVRYRVGYIVKTYSTLGVNMSCNDVTRPHCLLKHCEMSMTSETQIIHSNHTLYVHQNSEKFSFQYAKSTRRKHSCILTHAVERAWSSG